MPETEAVLGHHGHGAGGVGVGLGDLGGGLAGRDPVVEGRGRVGFEGHDVVAQDTAADGRVVPQESVAERGVEEGDAGLGVALGEFQVHAFDVQVRLLVLAHAVELLVPGDGLKAEG